jgi:diaminobutyrate-2-oxoglutarate transaminase
MLITTGPESSPGELPQPNTAAPAEYLFTDNELLERQRSFESNARTYPRRIPLALRRARGLYVEDIEGRRFIDCLACAGALPLGHNDPRIVEAIARALHDEVPMQTLDLTTPLKDEFVSELFALLPAGMAERYKIQFCGPAGTDAIEAALKLVKTATGRSGLLAFHGAYHGMSQGALSLMGNLGPKRKLGPLLAGVQFLPFPYAYRCPFGLGGEAGERAGLHYIRTVLQDPESGVVQPAGMVLEAVQGEGGVIPAPNGWLSEVRALTRHAGVPLVVDEVQTGIGRTGRFFAFEHAGIEPDAIVVSKAVGGGLPLSAVLYHESLDVWDPGAHAGTFRGNQLAMAAGAATLRIVRSERLDRHAERMGERMLRHLAELPRLCPLVGDVRGRGLAIGVELREPGAGLKVCFRAAQLGAVFYYVGSDVLELTPALTISDAELDEGVELIGRALADVADGAVSDADVAAYAAW